MSRSCRRIPFSRRSRFSSAVTSLSAAAGSTARRSRLRPTHRTSVDSPIPRSPAISRCVRPLVCARRTASSSNSFVNRRCCVIEFLIAHWELSTFPKQVHHQPLRVWVLCLYFMGLSLSNRQIAQELGLDGSDVQAMTEQLRRGLVAKIAPVRLEGEVEIDEVYVVAGHKGQPAAVAKGGGSDAAAGWRERRDAARWRRTSRRSSA